MTLLVYYRNTSAVSAKVVVKYDYNSIVMTLTQVLLYYSITIVLLYYSITIVMTLLVYYRNTSAVSAKVVVKTNMTVYY